MKRRTQILTVIAAVMMIVAIVPAGAAITRFADVPDTNIFARDIKWMDDNGITTGCGPDLFCPSESVTREQMAAFMHRLATSRAVDAGMLEGQTAADFATSGHNHDGEYVAQSGSATTASDLLRVAYYTFEGPKTRNDYATIGTFDITAPVDGFLMLSTSIQYRAEVTREWVYCGFELDGTLVNNSATNDIESSPTTPIRSSCDTEGVVPVTAGDHTITLLGYYYLSGDTYFEWGTASALFVPFDGSGLQPTAFPSGAAPEGQMP
jgi:hypothetical protein